MKFFTSTLALIATGTYASTSGGLATEDTDLRSLVEALATKVDEQSNKIDQQSNKIDQQSNKIAYLENKMIQGKKKTLRGLEEEVDQNLEEQYYHEYFDKIKEIDDALTTIQACLEFDTADGGTCTIGGSAIDTVLSGDLEVTGNLDVSGSGKSVFVSYRVKLCTQYEVSMFQILYLNLVCIYLIAFAKHLTNRSISFRIFQLTLIL